LIAPFYPVRLKRGISFLPPITIAAVYKLNFLFFPTPISRMQITIKRKVRTDKTAREYSRIMKLRHTAIWVQGLFLSKNIRIRPLSRSSHA